MIIFVHFLGDRLTDERVNGAQCAMKNENSPTERLEGFISKIEDFHRLMNFLEVCKVLLRFMLVIIMMYHGNAYFRFLYKNLFSEGLMSKIQLRV